MFPNGDNEEEAAHYCSGCSVSSRGSFCDFDCPLLRVGRALTFASVSEVSTTSQ